MNACTRLSRWLLVTALCLSPAAWGHKLHVFAFAEGERVSGQVYFAGGAPAREATLRVEAQGGDTLATPAVDAAGEFAFVVTQRQDYRILADAGDGHRAEWVLPARELAEDLPLAPGVELVEDRPASAGDDTVPGALGAQVERAVARQVRPLREQLLALEQRLRFQDILGALGYIFGLMGLGLWWKRRPPRPRPPSV